MYIRFRNSLRLLLAILTAVTFLSGCNDYYERPDHTYEPGYDYASDRYLVKNCKLRAENKISRKLGHTPHIKYGYVDINDISRHRSSVKGDAYVQDRNKQLRVDYHCTAERKNGRITDIDLNWRDKPGSGSNKINASTACKATISKKLQRETSGKIGIDFGKYDSSSMSDKRRRITGKAHITSRRGNGKINYDCVVHTRDMQVEQATYRWTQSLPSNGNGALDKKQSKQKCHTAVVNKATRDDYQGIKFQSTNFRSVGNSDLLVSGKMKMNRHGESRHAAYECLIKVPNGNLKKARYWLDKKPKNLQQTDKIR